jgi:hypothetical protein
MSYAKQQIVEIYRYSQRELDDLFATLPALDLQQLNGVYRGRLLAIAGLGILPRSLRAVLYRLLETIINPWRGKKFAAGKGSNIWFLPSGKLGWGHYRVEAENQILNYDVSENPALLRPIRGEACQLNNDVALARMNYLTKSGCFRVLYFTLEKRS